MLLCFLSKSPGGQDESLHPESLNCASISRCNGEKAADFSLSLFLFGAGEIPSVLLEQLIQGILVCLRSVAREVIKSCLGFFKVT